MPGAFSLLQPFLKQAHVTDAWMAGRAAFLRHSSRHTYSIYQDLYVRMADDYCFSAKVHDLPVDEDVLCAMLAWPAIEFEGLDSLSPRLKDAVCDFIPDIMALKPGPGLRDTLKTRTLPSQVHDLVLYLATTDTARHDCDLPPVQARLVKAFGAVEQISMGRVWARIESRLDRKNGGFPPDPAKKGPTFQ